ncbi:hypothetical protein BJ508DRAFT_118912 [Ascobolus immersus RN42]|uniref:Uncharacterized protein n=1 Tax=Ascobolus immersus RN42 TaxID=1160509 RepID=A0A3N4IHC6_ASCIM|nr:hypothetical protein BJ508DRAFT_118912 [Ascobolus immersus RN42]
MLGLFISRNVSFPQASPSSSAKLYFWISFVERIRGAKYCIEMECAAKHRNCRSDCRRLDVRDVGNGEALLQWTTQPVNIYTTGDPNCFKNFTEPHFPEDLKPGMPTRRVLEQDQSSINHVRCNPVIPFDRQALVGLWILQLNSSVVFGPKLKTKIPHAVFLYCFAAERFRVGEPTDTPYALDFKVEAKVLARPIITTSNRDNIRLRKVRLRFSANTLRAGYKSATPFLSGCEETMEMDLFWSKPSKESADTSPGPKSRMSPERLRLTAFRNGGEVTAWGKKLIEGVSVKVPTKIEVEGLSTLIRVGMQTPEFGKTVHYEVDLPENAWKEDAEQRPGFLSRLVSGWT